MSFWNYELLAVDCELLGGSFPLLMPLLWFFLSLLQLRFFCDAIIDISVGDRKVQTWWCHCDFRCVPLQHNNNGDLSTFLRNKHDF